ncbi:MAG TPA: hypothetical protein DCP19_07145 [Pseudomonas sp.]|nr:hypothetical protein [Pseudomonas sp.]
MRQLQRQMKDRGPQWADLKIRIAIILDPGHPGRFPATVTTVPCERLKNDQQNGCASIPAGLGNARNP